ncbi:hypothetical protein CISG_04702 [Coccidioides immitis RMSCC 3703]|uniref:Uncharacterized protein n=2 Tax=Coccidioides immitis TaxID=5501 RepID=A0A0J8QVG0_COCIT|nr:hypothetical protein CIRG_09515 [Coccidioides immitis RMSCC 2394]KMU75283.1 hypothetical protein CISG_04702 [Coccidioides immitis RMSCC 3703]
MDLQGRGMQTSAHWMSYLAGKKQNAAKVRVLASFRSLFGQGANRRELTGYREKNCPIIEDNRGMQFGQLGSQRDAHPGYVTSDAALGIAERIEPITHQQDIMAFKPVPMLLRALILGSTGARVVSYDLLRVLTTHGRERFTIVKFYCPTATKRDIHMAGLRRAGQGAGVTAALSYPQEQW